MFDILVSWPKRTVLLHNLQKACSIESQQKKKCVQYKQSDKWKPEAFKEFVQAESGIPQPGDRQPSRLSMSFDKGFLPGTESR